MCMLFLGGVFIQLGYLEGTAGKSVDDVLF